MIKSIHPIAGLLALMTISTFWMSTVIAELFGGPHTVRLVKTTIPWAFLWLVPLMIIAGKTGAKMGHRSQWAQRKARRMRHASLTGLFVLIPAALFLSIRAEAGVFDTGFYAVQLIELVAGAANILRLAANMRDGLQRRMKKVRRA